MVNKKALLAGAIVLAATLILSSFAVILITTFGANAQPDTEGYGQVGGIYLKIAGLDGESTVEGYAGWIEILSYDWNESGGSVSRAGFAARRAVPGDFHFVKVYDKSSPKLFLFCAQGKLIASAQLDVTKTINDKSVVFINYNFTSLVISSYGTSGEVGGAVLDEFSFSFAQLKVTYIQFNAEGEPMPPVTATYNFVTNTGS